MRLNGKPVRKCHACLLNLGDHCWLYADPRRQWSQHPTCPGFDNEEAYARFRLWQKQPRVKTGRELRRESRRSRRARPTPEGAVLG
jgi:hypothetical protein